MILELSKIVATVHVLLMTSAASRVIKCEWLSIDMKIHFVSFRHHGVQSL